jgi:cobalt-zinc-cadmium efflux system outer membrane protein
MKKVWLVLGSLLSIAPAALAQAGPLTLEEALQRARSRAPAILAARDRIAEARGRLRGASLLFQNNPEIEFAAGPRRGEGNRTTDIEAALRQSVELGGRRRARIAGAQALVEQARAESQNVVRTLLGDVAAAYLQAAGAQRRLELARMADEIAGAFQSSMKRRLEVGDVPVLDVNLAHSAAARTRTQLRAAEADSARALGDLRVFLGMQRGEELAVAGELPWSRDFDVDALITSALRRPDLLALEAELRQAEAEIRLGRSFVWPDVAPAVSYEREEGASIVKGGLSLSLPVFNRGQELQAVGAARATRLRRQLEASRRAVEVEVQASLAEYERRQASVADLEKNAIPMLNENEQLATRSYEEGEISLIELLLIRRDNLELRLLAAEAMQEAALAAVAVQLRAGVLQ